MGENALATTVELSKELARRRAKNVTNLDTENVVFFDVLGLFMVCTSDYNCLVLRSAENTSFWPVLHSVLAKRLCSQESEANRSML